MVSSLKLKMATTVQLTSLLIKILQTVALKRLKCSESLTGWSEGLTHHILREISVLQALRDHPNIIKLHDMYFMNTQKIKDSGFVLSFEYADRGDLHRYVCNLKQDIAIKKP